MGEGTRSRRQAPAHLDAPQGVPFDSPRPAPPLRHFLCVWHFFHGEQNLKILLVALSMIARPQAIHDAILFVESYTTGSTPEPVEQGWGLAAAFFLIYAVCESH